MSDNFLLEKYNFKMQKKYGQNFLTSAQIPSRIAANCTDFDFSSGNCAESLILEIGPGAGILTKELAKRFYYVINYFKATSNSTNFITFWLITS